MADRSRTAGLVVVISGPSGSGKTTVCNGLLDGSDFARSVSVTTRSPRPGEKDGVNYHFVSRDEFQRRVRAGEFAEHAEYNGHLYGTPREALERALAAGRTVLVEIDVQGARQLHRRYHDGLYIFLDAPDRRVAEARLEHRNTESPEERLRRIEAAERERSAAAREPFDHQVINDDLEDTVSRIRELIRGRLAAQTNA